MSIIKVREQLKNEQGQYDTIHRESEAELIKTADGNNVQMKLTELDSAKAPRESPAFTGNVTGVQRYFVVPIFPQFWVAENDYYTCTLNVPGLLSSDNPIMNLRYTSKWSTAESARNEYAKIVDGQATTDSLMLRAREVPAAALIVELKVVR